jgi:hypothetical protein
VSARSNHGNNGKTTGNDEQNDFSASVDKRARCDGEVREVYALHERVVPPIHLEYPQRLVKSCKREQGVG